MYYSIIKYPVSSLDHL